MVVADWETPKVSDVSFKIVQFYGNPNQTEKQENSPTDDSGLPVNTISLLIILSSGDSCFSYFDQTHFY